MTYHYATEPVDRPDKQESASLNRVYIRFMCAVHKEDIEADVELALLLVLAS